MCRHPPYVSLGIVHTSSEEDTDDDGEEDEEEGEGQAVDRVEAEGKGGAVQALRSNLTSHSARSSASQLITLRRISDHEALTVTGVRVNARCSTHYHRGTSLTITGVPVDCTCGLHSEARAIIGVEGGGATLSSRYSPSARAVLARR